MLKIIGYSDNCLLRQCFGFPVPILPTIQLQAYSSWTTNETIGHEMIRNLGVAIVAVIVVNALMLADFKLCFMVFLCVLFTLIDVTGICFYLGQNIDVISCICNVLVIGFCVDYCVHIAHAYLVSYGDRYTVKSAYWFYLLISSIRF